MNVKLEGLKYCSNPCSQIEWVAKLSWLGLFKHLQKNRPSQFGMLLFWLKVTNTHSTI